MLKAEAPSYLNGMAVLFSIRQLYNRGKSIINGMEYTQHEFGSEFKNIIFGLKEPYPTLRQLISKFIRVDDATSDNMIKYLQRTTNDTYDTIYLFLFKILSDDLLSEKDTLVADLRDCQSKLKYYQKDENIDSLETLEQRRELIENDLRELKDKRKMLDYMETYKEEMQKKRNS